MNGWHTTSRVLICDWMWRRRELPVARQVSLLETLAAAASQMAAADKSRPTAGPPPLLFLQRALPPADHLKPQHLNLFVAKAPAESVIGNTQFQHHPGSVFSPYLLDSYLLGLHVVVDDSGTVRVYQSCSATSGDAARP